MVGLATPGFNIAINSAKVAADGTITAVVTISDQRDCRLTSTALQTPGVGALSFTMGYIPANARAVYLLRAQFVDRHGWNFPATLFGERDHLDVAGAKLTALGNGQYQYVFGNKAPANLRSDCDPYAGGLGQPHTGAIRPAE